MLTNETKEEYTAIVKELEQGEAGDKLDYNPHQVIRAIFKLTGYKRDIIHTKTTDKGIEYYMYLLPNHKFVFTSYNKGKLNIISTGNKIKFEYNGGFDKEELQEKNIDNKDIEIIEEIVIEEIEKSGRGITDKLIQNHFYYFHMNKNNMSFDLHSPYNWFIDNQNVKQELDKISNKYTYDNVEFYDIILNCIRGDKELEYKYSFELV